MQLLDLPPELIHQIALSLHTQTDVAHLAQSSRRLHAEIVDSLYWWDFLFHGGKSLAWAAHACVPETLRCARDAGIDVSEAAPDLLHIAAGASTGRAEFIRLLVKEFGFDPSGYDVSGSTPLTCAARAGCVSVARALVDIGADPSQPSINGETPLHAAAIAQEAPMAAFLLAAGAPVSPQLTDFVALDPRTDMPPGTTPLHVAALRNACDVARVLLDHGADPTMAKITGGGGGPEPLQIAVRNHQAAMARLLLEHGADIALTGGADPGYAVYLAALHADFAMVRVLVEYGAPVCAGGELSCLRVALVNRHAEMALYLVDAGADLLVQGVDLAELASHLGMPGVARRMRQQTASLFRRRSQELAEFVASAKGGLTSKLKNCLVGWRVSPAAGCQAQVAH